MKVSLNGHIGERKRTANRSNSIFIEYVKQNLPMGRVFSHYGLPWVNGTHQLSCPFHGVDKNPSARYYEESKRIFCFACNEGWDVVAFIKKREGHQSYKETLSFILKEFGVGLSGTDLNKRISLEEKRSIEHQLGKRKIFGDTYANKVNDRIHIFKKLGDEVAEAIDEVIPRIFQRKKELDEMLIGYMKYTNLIRHWATWSNELLEKVVKRLAKENSLRRY